MTFPQSAPAAWPVFLRSYSRRLSDGSRESYQDVVERNLAGLEKLGRFTSDQMALLRRHQENLTSLPAGRWLWVGGTPWAESSRNFSGCYNCTSTNIDSFHSLSLLMDLAMMGAGTGAMLEAGNVATLPPIYNRLEVVISGELGSREPARRLEETATFVVSGPSSLDSDQTRIVISVGDSRSGWVRAFRQLLDCAADALLSSKGELTVVIDLSSVRPPGERLAGFGGVANPSELPNLFHRLAAVLNRAVGRKLTAIECCLLIDEAARAVVAGNIRRSAGMRQFSENDVEAAAAKDNLWQEDEQGNWSIDSERDALRMANHTRVFHHKPDHLEILDAVTRQHRSGEGAIQYAPEAIARANADLLGLSWLKSEFLDAYEQDGPEAARGLLASLLGGGDCPANRGELDHRMRRYGLNPCGEILGSDFHCNLAEVHLNNIPPGDMAQIREAFEAAALSVCALLHHEFNEPRYRLSRALDPIVGVSFTGLFDHFALKFGSTWLQWWADGRPVGKLSQRFRPMEARALRGFREVVETQVAAYCEEHGLRVPNRCTTVQPAGTKSLLTGASPGWHPPKATRFLRRVTFAKGDPIALACLDYGYTVVPSQSDKDENGRLLEDPFDPRCTEWLVEMPVEVSWANMAGSEDVDPSRFSALAQFDFYMQVQTHYTTHNTSATIELKEDEIAPLARAIHASINSDRGYISAALLARSDCHASFPRMPYEAIDKATYNRLRSEVIARRSSSDFMEALARHDTAGTRAEAQGPAGCDSDACLLPLTGHT
jgi:ribonucleotide reductase class II